MRTILLSLLIGALTATAAFAQGELRDGHVFEIVDGDTVALVGAHVFWIGDHEHGRMTDEAGYFQLHMPDGDERRLVASYVGYEPDTLVPPAEQTHIDFYLEGIREIGEVVVEAEASSSFISKEHDLKTEVVTELELQRAACCDLAGCFSRTTGVDNEAADVITDTKQLKMLSVDGVYTQVLIDNIPWMTNGLNTRFAVSHIPGTQLDKIAVSKGLGSVLQGYESISGQVNAILKDAEADNLAMFNMFANSFRESQYNLNAVQKVGDWNAILTAHSTQEAGKVDGDGDSFLDVPLVTRYMIYNKWKYESSENETESYTAVKFLDEQREGGQGGFSSERDRGTVNAYGQSLNTRRFDAYHKTSIDLGDESSLEFLASASTHTMDSYFGTTEYIADQQSVYGDVRYRFITSEVNQITVGTGYRYLGLNEDISFLQNPHAKTYDGMYETDESIIGVFAENKHYFFDDALLFTVGLRTDYHNKYDLLVTPRVLAKYVFDDFTTLRASAGMGYRSPHIFSEQFYLMASWRDIEIDPAMDIEEAFNYGVNFTHQFDAFAVPMTFGLDLYRTEFTNQIRADYDADPSKILFTNLDGRSISNSVIVEVSADPMPGLDLKSSYTFSDVYEENGDKRDYIEFVPKHKVLGTVSYEFVEGWRADGSVEWMGSQILPNTEAYPEQFQIPHASENFTMLGFQLTRTWEFFDTYAGVENILDHRQENPILNAQNPFERYFEPTFVWGNVKGREFYAGIRWRIGTL
ncbi:MAG: TonB-dependent receptor [Ectothiorhodospiraceae bacterium]|nr:TonB-dependent receptor [Ectothiorhodospiraceae bacterium]